MFNLIIQDILTALLRYAPIAILTGLLVMSVICLILRKITKVTMREVIRKYHKVLFLTLIFYVYSFIVVSITYLSREPGSRDRVDLKLFSTFSGFPHVDRYPIENILLFIPFGFLLPFLLKRFKSVSWCITASFLFSLLIEVSQFLTKRGFFQTDDIVTNVIGAMIGWCLAFGSVRAFRFLKR